MSGRLVRNVMLLLCGVLSACAKSELPRTQVMVEIDADPAIRAQASRLEISVKGGASFAHLGGATRSTENAPFTWPERVALVPQDGNAKRVFEVTAAIFAKSGNASDGEALVQSRVRSGYIEGKTLLLRLKLSAACSELWSQCDESEKRCEVQDGAAACVPLFITPSSLPNYKPSTPSKGGAGSGGDDAGGPQDASTDPNTDSGSNPQHPKDGGGPDADGNEPIDASEDEPDPTNPVKDDPSTPDEDCNNRRDDDDDGDTDCDDADCEGDADCPVEAPPPEWQPFERIGHEEGTDQVSNYDPRVAVAPNGDTLVAFYDDGVVWARRYVAATQEFDDLFQLSDASSKGVNPLLAVDGDGNAIVGWYGSNAGDAIFARKFAADLGWPDGWGAIETVQAGAGTSTEQTLGGVAMTANGHACVSWELRDYSGAPDVYESYVRVWDATRGWDVVRKTSGASTNAQFPRCGITQIGQDLRVVVAWGESATPVSVMGAIYTYNLSTQVGTLGAPTSLESEATLDVLLSNVAMDTEGNAFVAMYRRGMAGAGNILVNRYTGGIWTGGAPLDATDAASQVFDLDVHPNGDAWVLWRQCPTSTCAIWGRRFEDDDWDTAVKISADDDYVSRPVVAIDADGHALAVWISRAVGVDSMFASEFTPGVGWTRGHLIEDDDDHLHGVTYDLDYEHGVGLAAWVRQEDLSGLGGSHNKIFGALYR